jgi:hypothetical protein
LFLKSKSPWQKTVERRGGLTTGLAGAFVLWGVTALGVALSSFKTLRCETFFTGFSDGTLFFLWECGAIFLKRVFQKKYIQMQRKNYFPPCFLS